MRMVIVSNSIIMLKVLGEAFYPDLISVKTSQTTFYVQHMKSEKFE